MPDDHFVKPKLRWFHLTPGRLLVILLAVEEILLLSERFQWFAFNEKKGWTVLIAVAAVGLFLLVMLFWFIVSLIFRWHFQFSIRSLLVLTIAVAFPFSWLAVEMKWAKEQREAVEALIKLGGQVKYDFERNTVYMLSSVKIPPGPSWLRKLLGNDFFWIVNSVDLCTTKPCDADLKQLITLNQLKELDLRRVYFTDAGLQQLGGMKRLQILQLTGTQITDVGLEQLRGLNQLQHLFIGETKITDDGLKHLKGLKELQVLLLWHTQITDAGLRYLGNLKHMQVLFLSETQITDVGLKELQGLSQLKTIDLWRTKVTDAGVAKLQKALPNCTIYH